MSSKSLERNEKRMPISHSSLTARSSLPYSERTERSFQRSSGKSVITEKINALGRLVEFVPLFMSYNS